jgi:hypothetical protein
LLGAAPAPLARHELIALPHATDRDGLKEAVLPDGFDKPLQRGGIYLLAGLEWVGGDGVRRDLNDLMGKGRLLLCENVAQASPKLPVILGHPKPPS